MKHNQPSTADSLKRMGRMMLDLAERLSAKGEPPNAHDKELIRLAGLPLFRESMQIMTTAYLLGDTGSMMDEMERIRLIAEDYQ